MAARHRTRRTVGRGRVRVPVAMAVVAALVLVTAVTVRLVAASATGCTGSVALRVVTAPEIRSALDQIGQAWMQTKPAVGGECVALTVAAQESPNVASELSVFAGSAIDVAAAPQPTPLEESLPAVWIPDSISWLGRVQVVDRAAFEDNPQSIATSPVVIAMPAAAVAALGQTSGRLPVDAVRQLLSQPGGLKLGVAEPRRESASLAAMMLLGDALAPTEDQLPTLVRTLRGLVKVTSTVDLLEALGKGPTAGPASEQAVLAHNASDSPVKLVAVQLDPVLAQLDYPFAIRSGVSRQVAQAAESFRAAILAASSARTLAAAGFRTPDGAAADGFPQTKATSLDQFVSGPIEPADRVQRTLGLWSASNSPSRTLAMFDVTSSMGTIVPGTNASRAQVMVAAAKSGLELFTNDSRVGMWAFGAQHQEVLPIADLTPQRRQEFDERMAGATPVGSNRSELYQTVLDAYKLMREGYDPKRPNIIVIITDGGDSDPGGLRLERFRQNLQHLADPTKPIRVVLIGVGVGSRDAQDLQAIAQVVGGSFFPMTSPDQIQLIFLKALLRVGAA